MFHFRNIKFGGEGRFMHAGPPSVRTWGAIGHVVVQSFFHQPLRSFSLCVLPAHARKELPVHMRSCFLLSRSMCFAVARHRLAMPKRDPYKKLSADEVRLAKVWCDEVCAQVFVVVLAVVSRHTVTTQSPHSHHTVTTQSPHVER